MNSKQIGWLLGTVIVLLIAIIASHGTFGTVVAGTYHVKQGFLSGKMEAIMAPGPYLKNFGTIEVWPVGDTFLFAKDTQEDDSIEVRFNDGSLCHISGTCRIDLPKSEQDAVNLISINGFKSYKDVENKLLLPTVRKSLIMTANLMSAKESYSEKRADFFKFAWDQINNGIYVTKEEVTEELDPVTGQKVSKARKVIMLDPKTSQPLREQNSMTGSGIHLSNFEIKNFEYEPKVQQQIATQQEAIMSVQTARAQALKAEQETITIKAQGEAQVMTAKYVKEQDKIKATVTAMQEQEVAVIKAQQLVEVATKAKEQALVTANQEKEVAAIELEAAKLTKQKAIEIATGESESKRLILDADGALTAKLKAYVDTQTVWADAFSKRLVPNIVMGDTGGHNDGDVTTLMQMMGIKAARDLMLDTTIPAKK